jgi:hypothetical protein
MNRYDPTQYGPPPGEPTPIIEPTSHALPYLYGHTPYPDFGPPPTPPPPEVQKGRVWFYWVAIALLACICASVYVVGVGNGYASGYTNGQKDGFSNGQHSGYTRGYTQGKADGYNQGHLDGYDKGLADGKGQAQSAQDSYSSGYTQGETDALANLYAYLNNSCGKDIYGYYHMVEYQDATGSWRYTCVI